MDRASTGSKARRRGHLLEYVALLHLMLKGYRILGFRLKTPCGEIDILAVKARRLAIVEVKSRMTPEAAIESVSATQQHRLWQAGLALQAKKPHLARLDLNIDLYTLTPGSWPRHIVNAFEASDRF